MMWSAADGEIRAAIVPLMSVLASVLFIALASALVFFITSVINKKQGDD